MELTGPAGEYGQAGAKSVEMAFRDLNAVAGAQGCALKTDTRDSHSVGTVAVDAATQLVQVEHVPVIIGGIISSVTIPILTAVTAPAKVVQVSPASSSPTLTELGRDGKTNGIFFRTITSDALQGVAAARYAVDQGFKKIAIIHVNNDFGANLAKEFSAAYKALGGTITTTTPYNEKQASYDSEATAGMAGESRRRLPDLDAGRRRHHRPRLGVGGRAAEVPAERRHELERLHHQRRRGIPQGRLRHLVGHDADALHHLFQRHLQGLLGARPGQSGGRPLV